MTRAVLFTLLSVVSSSLYAQSAWDTYKEVMSNLTKVNQNVKVQSTVHFADGRVQNMEYEYGADRNGFYSKFSDRDYILIDDWYVFLDHTDKVLVVDINLNEGQRSERLEQLIESMNSNITDGNVSNYFSVQEMNEHHQKILIQYPNNQGLFSKGYLIYKNKGKRLVRGEFVYEQGHPNRHTNLGEVVKVSFQYSYTNLIKDRYLSIKDVFSMKHNLLEIKEAYSNYKVYNLTGFGFINIKR